MKLYVHVYHRCLYKCIIHEKHDHWCSYSQTIYLFKLYCTKGALLIIWKVGCWLYEMALCNVAQRHSCSNRLIDISRIDSINPIGKFDSLLYFQVFACFYLQYGFDLGNRLHYCTELKFVVDFDSMDCMDSMDPYWYLTPDTRTSHDYLLSLAVTCAGDCRALAFIYRVSEKYHTLFNR